MPPLAAAVADIRRAVDLLVAADDPAATRTAQALMRWLQTGEDFASALDLPTDWHYRLRVAARDRALAELSRLHGDEDCSTLAARIVAGLSRARRPGGCRRDGSLGFIDDLAATDCRLGARQLRRLIGDIRRGHQDECDGHGGMAA